MSVAAAGSDVNTTASLSKGSSCVQGIANVTIGACAECSGAGLAAVGFADASGLTLPAKPASASIASVRNYFFASDRPLAKE